VETSRKENPGVAPKSHEEVMSTDPPASSPPPRLSIGCRLSRHAWAVYRGKHGTAGGADMSTRDLEAFNQVDEPALSLLTIRFVRDHRRLPTGHELAAMWLPAALAAS
jgi:hypothetical protein